MPKLSADPEPEELERELDDEITDFEPSPLPPMAPDGGPIIPPVRSLPVIPEGQGLCSSGPGGVCAHYHRMVIALDAQRPIDGSDPVPVEKVVHTCYPHPGIETDLGEQHVFECNRYTPSTQRTRPSSPSSTPRAAPRSARGPSKKRRSGRR